MSALAIRSNPYGQMQDLQLAVIRLQEGMNGLSASTNLDQLKQITDLYNTHCIKLALLEQQIDNNSDIFINVSNRLCNIEDQIHLRKLSQKVSALQLEINGIPGSINSDQLKRITDLYNEYLGKLTPFQNHISDNTINIYNNIEDNLTTIEGQIRPFHTSIAKPGFFSSIPTSLKTAFVVGAAYWWFCDPSLLKVAAVAGITGIATHKLTNKPEELPPSSIPSADPVSAHDSHSSVGPLPTLTTAHGSLVSSSYDDLRHGQIARAAAYSASSSSSSSSTPMSTKYPIQVVHSYTGGNRWIQFFLGTGRDDFGRTLQDILTKDDIWLEAQHNYIQGLFLNWEKLRRTPTLTPEIQNEFLHGPYRAQLQHNLRQCFLRMLDFYGFEYKNGKVLKNMNPHSMQSFERRKQWLWINGSHNLLRLTRIMFALNALGLSQESSALFQALKNLYEETDALGRPKYKKYIDGENPYAKSSMEYWKETRVRVSAYS